MDNNLYDEKEYKLEAQKHKEFLNLVLGVIAFTLALTCLGFDHPQRVAILCLAIIIPIYITAFKSFPAILQTLRELKKETKDENEKKEVKEIIDYLEKEYHGWESVFKHYWTMWAGLALYACVLIYPKLFDWFIE